MKFSVQLPTDRVERSDEFHSLDAISEMASTIERSGFDACYVTEHPFPSDDWLAGGGHHSLDPFVALTAAAAATHSLRLHTNILVLPYRNPFLTAKAVASLDVVSEGRVIMGVAAGYLEGEYAALGADFASRNELTDEALVAIKAAWSGQSVKRAGRTFAAPGNTMLPVPSQRPHPPVWVGGNSRAAIRRAIEHGQGWSPFPLPAVATGKTRTASIESVGELAGRIEYLRDYAKEIGREDPIDVNFVPFGLGMNTKSDWEEGEVRAQLGELAAAGVTWVSLGLPFRSRTEYLEQVVRFGEAVIG